MDKLKELDVYLSKLEQDNNNKSGTLSYAGAWKDIDDCIFTELTDNLINNRQKNRRRIDECVMIDTEILSYYFKGQKKVIANFKKYLIHYDLIEKCGL